MNLLLGTISAIQMAPGLVITGTHGPRPSTPLKERPSQALITAFTSSVLAFFRASAQNMTPLYDFREARKDNSLCLCNTLQ